VAGCQIGGGLVTVGVAGNGKESAALRKLQAHLLAAALAVGAMANDLDGVVP